MADRNLISFDNPSLYDGTSHDLGVIVAPTDGIRRASAIKITAGVRDLTVRADVAPGFGDAIVDINNRALRPRVLIGEGMPNGQFAATIKGGTVEPYLEIRRLLTRGKVCDVILGDWSDQTHDPVLRPILNICPGPGFVGKVRVLVLKSDKPQFVTGSGPYEFLFPWPVLNPPALGYPAGTSFEILRRAGFFRAQAN